MFRINALASAVSPAKGRPKCRKQEVETAIASLLALGVLP
jgi:hypothetical protein